MSDMSKRYRPRDGVLVQEVHGELVLLDLQGEVYFGLNPVGSRIWQLLAEQLTVATVMDRLLEEFDVGRERLERDVDGLVRELLERKLICSDGG